VTCRNPRCQHGKEQIVILLETPITIVVSALMGIGREPRTIQVSVPCHICRPEQREKWNAAWRKNHPQGSLTGDHP
jgi:hypothetical protein